MAETAYAQFGHWLTVDRRRHMAAVVHTYALTAHPANTPELTITDDLTDESAEYSGTAVGMSLHKEFDADRDVVPGSTQSGAFTASVTLTATFGAEADQTVSGMIDGFTSSNDGDNVDLGWTVELEEAASLVPTAQTGVAQGNGTGGRRVDGTGLWRYGRTPDRYLRRLQRSLGGRTCCRGVRHSEIVVTETGSRTPFPRKGGHLCRPSFFGQFGGGHHGMHRTSSGGFGWKPLSA